MKKIFALLLIMLICISVVACTKQADENASTSAATDTAEITTNVPDVDDTDTEETVDEPNTGGDLGKYIYRAAYSIDYYNHTSPYGKLAEDQEAYKKWRADAYDYAMYLLKEKGDREAYENLCISTESINPTVENLIEKFNIPKEKFLEKNTELGEYAQYTEAQIEALYSGDRELIIEQFMNPCAIYVNGEIYTPQWILDHTVEELKAVGITKDILEGKLDAYDRYIASETEYFIDLKNKIENFDKTAE